jgi:hypothetical protein
LIYLRKLVHISPSAMDAWLGPLTRRHDFAKNGYALEVKSTTSRKGRLARINGVLQLENKPHDALFLGFLRVEENDGGESIPHLVEDICKVSGRRLQVMTLLAKLGYLAEHESNYWALRFSILESRMYRVDSAFPRIVPASFLSGGVPAGVVEIEYTIELASEPPTPVGNAEEERVLKRLCGLNP